MSKNSKGKSLVVDGEDLTNDEVHATLSTVSSTVTVLKIHHVDDLDLSILKDKTHIESLSIYDCNVRIDTIECLPNGLYIVHIAKTNLDTLDRLNSLTSLIQVTVRECAIDSVSDTFIDSHKQLKALSIDNTYIDDDAILTRLLNGLPHLQTLSLNGNCISGPVDETALTNCKSIKSVYLHNTYMTRPKGSLGSSEVTYVNLDYRFKETGRLPLYPSNSAVKVYLLNDRGDAIRDAGYALQSIVDGINMRKGEYHSRVLQLVKAMNKITI